MKRLAVIAIIFGAAFQLQAQGYIVPNGVTYAGFNIFGGYEIDVMHDVANTEYTRFFLGPLGKTQPTIYTNTFSFSEFLDVGVRVFLVSSNDPISLQPISSQSYIELGSAPSYVFRSGIPFYVALYTGWNFAPPYPPYPPYTYLDPVFGWAKLVNNQGIIQLLDSALEYQGGGIYAGTQNIIPVPEPSGLALFGVSTLLLGFFLRRNSSR